MSDNFYKTLNVDIYPLKAEVSTYPMNTNPGPEFTQYNRDELSPEILDFFESRQIKLKDTFSLKLFMFTAEKRPHNGYRTDGDYDSPPNTDCVLIWIAIPENKSKFVFANTENSTHSYDEVASCTIWEGTTPISVNMEFTSKPILANTQIPHYMETEITKNVVCYLKLNFDESWSSMVAKLSDDIFVPAEKIIEGYVPPYKPI